MNTGPTGPTGTTIPMISTGPPPASPDSQIVTLEELMSSHSATIAKEAADTQTLTPLLFPTRDLFRPQLFQWAAGGFPDLYIIRSFTVTPPAICADGVTREIGQYIEYCLKVHLGEVIDKLKGLMTGIQPSWSTDGNTLRIHVSRI